MRWSLVAQVVVLIGLLLIAALCLTSRPAEDFAEQKAPELYAAGIKKLESTPAFDGKENVVAVVKTLVEANTASLDSNASQARFTRDLGLFSLVLAAFQAVALLASLRKRS